ncbi:MAG: M20/M25/M40 family metallo-hydrolase [Acidobacteriota bacterium]
MPSVRQVLLWLLIATAAALPCRGGDGPRTVAPGSLPEAVRWFQEYLQIDTTNPPGNERKAAEYLAAILAAEGIHARLLDSPGGRTSLYARMEAPGSDRRAMVLVHHIDVVPAGEGWRTGPFSGRLLEGNVWGRGAIDVKGFGIAQLAAMVALRRERVPLDRDVVFLAVADEETGGREGAAWLLEAHPELFEGVEGVVNEGGNNRVINDRLVWWGVEVIQKRPLWMRVTAEGRGGHASGFHPASATHRLVQGLGRLIDRPPRFRVSDAARLYLGAVGELEGSADDLDELFDDEGKPTRMLPPGLPVYFLDTLQVTQIDNGVGTNVVAPKAVAHLDVRLLPDTDADAFLADVRETLGPDLEVEVTLDAPMADASPQNSPVYRALERALGHRAPVVPTFLVGTTDSRYFRARGIPAYGLSPFTANPPDLRGIHAPDEYLPKVELLRGIETVRRVILAYGTVEGRSGG